MIAGVDEAGRGPLAGAVFAAAVILDPRRPIAGLDDSKKLSATKREALAQAIKEHALDWCVASCSAREIDESNILQASLLAMRRAVLGLKLRPAHVQVDGNKLPVLPMSCEAIVRGDALVKAISAASILAKTSRDAALIEMDVQYPGYGFARHKGYPTPEHMAALSKLGPCAEHRQSFAPVHKCSHVSQSEQTLLPW